MIKKFFILLSIFLLLTVLPYQIKAQIKAQNKAKIKTQNKAENKSPKNPIKKPTSSTTTTIDSNAVSYFTSNLENLSFNRLNSIDTSLFRLQQYDPSFKNNSYYASLGNLGLPSKNLIFNPNITEGFNYKKSYLDLYSYSFEKVQYYYLIKPYTEITYVSGPAKEQRIQVIHSQNIAPGLNLSLKSIFQNSPGAYTRQRADDRNVFVSTYYISENKRYAIAASYIHDIFIIEESGGIKYDSIFTLNLTTNRRLIDPMLYSAKNTIIKGGISINSYFNIGSPPTKSTDSLGVTLERKGFRFGRLSHSFKYERRKFFFDNNSSDTAYFQAFGSYLNTSLTKDSITVKTIDNEFRWSNLDYDDHPEDKTLYFYIALKQRLTRVIDTLNTTTNTEVIPKAGISLNFSEKLRLNADAYYIIGDHNNGDQYLNVQAVHKLNYKGKSFGNLAIQATYKNQSPDWFYEYYQGNVFRWTNSFEKENIAKLKIEYTNEGLNLKIGAKYIKINNYLYLNTKAIPNQLNESLTVGSAYLNYTKQINKWLFDVNLIYQKTSAKILRLPQITANVTVSMTQKFLQNVALLQPGIELFYNSSYYADSYMPMHRSFYLQNNQVLGNYIYADLFLNVRIKRTLIFLKLQHINAGYTGFNYMMVPGYPMPDRGLRFGLSWKFYD